MGYKQTHLSRGLKLPADPGGLSVEERYMLSLNNRVFPNLSADPATLTAEQHDRVSRSLFPPLGPELGPLQAQPGNGYELFFNGRQVSGPEASYYALCTATANLAWNLLHNDRVRVTATYNGTALSVDQCLP